MKASVCTLGCRVNQYESDAIAEGLRARGFTLVPYGEACDVVILNTCTVTGESDRKSRQLIRRTVRTVPGAVVIVTGCFSQISPQAAAALGADVVVGNEDKGRITPLCLQGRRTFGRRSVMICGSPLPGGQGPISKLKTAVKTGVPIALFLRQEDRCVPGLRRRWCRRWRRSHLPAAAK